MNELSNGLLWIMSAALCINAILLDYTSFSRIVKRMKWLFISILIIYGFSTPGEYILQSPNLISPTKEGCILGLVQLAKLLVALATLNILFSTSTRSELMTGLHLFLSPLKYLSINTDTFTARLLLTLDYVEVFASKEKVNFSFDQLDEMFLSVDLKQKNSAVVLESPSFKRVDKLLIILIVIFFLSYICFRVLRIEELF